MRGLLVAVLVVVWAQPAFADPARPKAVRVMPAVWRAKAKPVAPASAKPMDRSLVRAWRAEASPKDVYRAAQEYRLKGERGKAIEMYEKYLELSPKGPAANACKSELEKLRDVPE